MCNGTPFTLQVTFHRAILLNGGGLSNLYPDNKQLDPGFRYLLSCCFIVFFDCDQIKFSSELFVEDCARQLGGRYLWS